MAIQLNGFQAASLRLVNPRFGQETPTGPKRAPRDAEIKWYYEKPQSKDVIAHSAGHQTKATSLIGGGQIFHNINWLLSKAKESVLVDLYEIQDGNLHPERTSPDGTFGYEYQQKILTNLVDLHQKGVKVKVILDNSYDEEKGQYHNEKTIAFLRANGVETLTYPRDAAKISHVKLVIVDGKSAVIGGMNWGNHSPVNHDACVMLEGDEVANLVNQVFKVDYEFAGGDVKTLPQLQSIPEENIRILTTSPAESPDGGQNEVFGEIIKRIDNAQKSILCELFVLTDKTIAQKLLEAHKRLTAAGEEGVRIIVDPGLYLKFPNCRPTIDMLKKNGVPIKFYASDWTKEEKLHSKWAVFDEKELMVGSANWSKVGLQSNGPKPPGFSSPLQFTRGNHEANVAIVSPTLCKAFVKQFNFDWLKKTWNVGGLGQLINKVPQPIRGEMLPWTNKPPLEKKPA